VILRRIFPTLDPLELDVLELDQGQRNKLIELYRPPRPDWFRINFITSVSGSTGGSDGTSKTLTNPVDRRVLSVIRELSDVVMIGAGTLRAEGYLRPKRSRLAIVTVSGDLAGHGLKSEGEPVIVFCPSGSVDRVAESLSGIEADVVALVTPTGRLSPEDIREALHARALTSIVCEGGPTFARECIEAGIVDELCLSTSPVLNGGKAPLLGNEFFEGKQLTLRQLLVDEASGLYARWAIENWAIEN
jgi:riboflavin biosynthesis pyrimidine reductase